MEREGREKKRGRRGGVEMRKVIVIGGMVLSLLLGCNNGGEDPQKVFLKSVVSLGNEFLNVFTSFGDVFNSSLGFKKDLKKSDVREYFKNVRDKVEDTKTALNKIVTNMKNENNPNAENVGTVVKTLIENTLNKIIKGAETASGAIGEASESLGNVAPAGARGAGGVKGETENLIKGIQGIVEVVLKDKGDPAAGDDKKAENVSSRGATAGEAGKLFGNDDTGATTDAKKAVGDVAKAVGAVTGADILKAMIKEGGDADKLAKHDDAAARVSVTAKDAVIAGGIALRAMAKNGKFANGDGGNDIKEGIKNVAISAVTKALDTLTIAIRKTIDEELKKVKEAMNINANDNTVISEAKS